MAILSHLASTKYMKNTHDFCCLKSFCFSGNHLAPLADKSVHGGCAIIRFHSPGCVCVCISSFEGTISIYQREYIPLNMPFRMTAGTRLKITAKGFMSSFPKCLTHFLAFFTSYQYPHSCSFCFPPFMLISFPALQATSHNVHGIRDLPGAAAPFQWLRCRDPFLRIAGSPQG